MLNFPVEPGLLASRVPGGTELDAWGGTTYASLVGFRFLDTRVLGLPIPFHRDFDEINLRFYVRRRGPEGWRRGVVFVREVVPKAAIAAIARWVYNEQYVACRTSSEILLPTGTDAGRVAYRWKSDGKWLAIGAEFSGVPALLEAGSEEEFITEHYWGYAVQRDGGTVEYQVEHPSWRVWPGSSAVVEGDCAGFYGPDFAETFAAKPSSVFVAEGSDVIVRQGVRL